MEFMPVILVLIVVRVTNSKPAPNVCRLEAADVVFLLDTSGSIKEDNFQKELSFICNVVDYLDVGPSDQQTQVGVLTFSDDVMVQFHLGKYVDKESVRKAVEVIPYTKGHTNTASALSTCGFNMFSSEYSARQDVERIAVVVTDGKSDDERSTARQARVLKARGIHIFAVGVGPKVSDRELADIASSPPGKFVFRVEDFDALEPVLKNLTTRVCELQDLRATTSPASSTSTETSTTSNPINSTTNPKTSSNPINSTTNPKTSSNPVNSTTNPKTFSNPVNSTTNPKTSSNPVNSTTNPKTSSTGYPSTSPGVRATTSPAIFSATETSTTSNPINSTTNPKTSSTGYPSTSPDLCYLKAVDVVFVMDTASSIGAVNWQKELKFVIDVIEYLDIGPSDQQTRVGVLTFGSDTSVQFHLGEYVDNKSLLIYKMKSILYSGGGTNTAKALRVCREEMFSPDHSPFPNSKRIAVVITDGHSNDIRETAREAIALKATGIDVFAVGVGSQVVNTELDAIASSPTSQFLFKVDNFDALGPVINTLTTRVCVLKAAQLVPTSVSASSPSTTTGRDDSTVYPGPTLVTTANRSTTTSRGDSTVYPGPTSVSTTNPSTTTSRGDSTAGPGQTSVSTSNPSTTTSRDGSTVYPGPTSVSTTNPSTTTSRDDSTADTGPTSVSNTYQKTTTSRDDSTAYPGPTSVSTSNYNGTTRTTTRGRNSTTHPTEELCRMKAADVVFLLDTSGSIGKDNFQKELSFICNVVDYLDVGPSGRQTQVGVLTFSDDVTVQFHLGKHVDKESVRKAAELIPYTKGHTNTASALRTCGFNMFSPEYSPRQDVERIAVVITDGKSNNERSTARQARVLKARGIHIFAVGVGPHAPDNEFEVIASFPSSQFVSRVENFDALEYLLKSLTTSICGKKYVAK